MNLRRAFVITGVLLLPLLLLLLAAGALLFARQGGFDALRVPIGPDVAVLEVDATPAALERGRYLAQLGNCQACHTPRGGTPFAGGRAFPTPYGTVFSSNLTPDPVHGIGDWSPAEFRHAMRHGVSRNGLQSPVFPYANFARLDDADLDALFVFLRALPPLDAAVPENALEFPATLPGAMLAWRMLHYRPAPPATMPAAADGPGTQPASLRRGKYLVDGIGHCALCHGTRGAMGSLPAEGYLAGGSIPGVGWYAPPLDEASLARFDVEELATYLRSGNSDHGAAYGLMADVVVASLRHLEPADARAMAAYLRSVPAHPRPPVATAMQVSGQQYARGAALYETRCASCHGDDGEGEPGKYPPLVGAVAVTAPDPANAVRMVLYGGVPPSNDLNPQPYSMPPFAHQLPTQDIAAVVNYMRQRWGDAPRAVTADDIGLLGGTGLH